MSFTCSKTTIRLLRILSRNCELNHEIGFRSYASKVFSSASPHHAKVKPKASKLRENLDDEASGYEIQKEWHIDLDVSNKPSATPLWDASVKMKNNILRENMKNKHERHSDKQSDDELESLYQEAYMESGLCDDYLEDEKSSKQKEEKSSKSRRHPKFQTNVSSNQRKPPVKQTVRIKGSNDKKTHVDHKDGAPKQEENKKAILHPPKNSTFVSKDAVDEEQFDTSIGEIDENTQTALTHFVSCIDNDESDPTLEATNQLFSELKSLDTEGKLNFDLSKDEFNQLNFLTDFKLDVPGPLDKCDEDLSDFGPGLSPTFNVAAYADKAELIQEYVKLGVNLYKIEKDQDCMRALLTVDLKEELPKYIQFLHDCGVPADRLGDVITKSPMVLKENMDDLKTRIRYLRAHDFSRASIARIVTDNPTWLTWSTKHIDERLGHFQNEFNLSGSEVRFVATRQPRLITYNFKKIHEATFATREQMGFDRRLTKFLLISKPRLWMISRRKVVAAFDYAHNVMNLSHLLLAQQADVLTCRKNRLQSRHEFLKSLKLDQYDPKKPNYIAPKTIVYGSDAEFCRDLAKTAVDTYNLFLRTQ
ncbi:hypothetical protein QAD02_019342 [Eretmocerus hayati]|uniref:Uncharacterized protein n=1 Tax=Eretmocerus hayati TaxID=131215 RepID=A0ACC2PP41_9HYME|nr:hypothetical protein QAD02_019342 [Eretmocerus hayati]